jgi:hypothetical protein
MGTAEDNSAISQPGNMLLGLGSKAVLYFAFPFSAETKRMYQADICQIFKKACKSHKNSPIISKGEGVSNLGWGVQMADPTASVVVVLVSDGDM